MLQPEPPELLGDREPDDDDRGPAQISSVEVNILIYLYLLESNFQHSAYLFLNESALPSTSLFQHYNPTYPSAASASTSAAPARPPGAGARANGKDRVPDFGKGDGRIPRGELVRKLWRAVRWEEVERHVGPNGEPSKKPCPNPFHLLIPHVCPPSLASSSLNPSGALPTLSPPPSRRPEAFPPAPASVRSDKGKRKARGSPPPPPPVPKRRAKDDEDGMDVDERPNGANGRDDSPATAPSPQTATPGPAPGPSGGPSGGSKRRRKEGVSPASKKAGASTSVVPVAVEGGTLADVNGWVEHRDAVTGVAWNPVNPDSLASCSGDGTARLWELHAGDGRELVLGKKPGVISHKSIDTGKTNIAALAWHPDGTVLATGASDGVGRLFTPSGQLQGILSYGRGAINSLRFSPSGMSLLVARDDFTVTLFSLRGDMRSQSHGVGFDAHSKEVNDVDWLDDEVFASAGNDHLVLVHRASERRPHFTLRGHSDDVTRVRWAPRSAAQAQVSGGSERLLASVGDDGYIIIWRLPYYPKERSTGSRSLSPTKREATASTGGGGTATAAGTPTPGAGTADELWRDGLAGSEYCLHRLQVVDGSENKRMSTLEWCTPSAGSDRMLVAAGGQDSTVKLFDAVSGELLHMLAGLESGTGSLAFSPPAFGPARALAAGGWDAKVVVWDVATGRVVRTVDFEEEAKRQSARDRPMMMTAAWRADGKYIAFGLHNKALVTVSMGDLAQAVSGVAGEAGRAVENGDGAEAGLENGDGKEAKVETDDA
ncbi:hypothetical protein Q5752_000007 [Cryptotrichosporon argae]